MHHLLLLPSSNRRLHVPRKRDTHTNRSHGGHLKKVKERGKKLATRNGSSPSFGALPALPRYSIATPSSPSPPHHHSLPALSLPISPPPPPAPRHPTPRLARRPAAGRRRTDHGALHRDEEGNHALRGPEARHLRAPEEGFPRPSLAPHLRLRS